MPAGRPTKYRPEMCERIVGEMAKGLSKEAAAYQLGICTKTLYNWGEEHPEFLQALKRGEQASLAKWEDLGLRGVQGYIEGFNASAWIFNMKNRAHWRDRQDVTSNNETINITVNLNGRGKDD